VPRCEVQGAKVKIVQGVQVATAVMHK
jgi:hypothetical protein